MLEVKHVTKVYKTKGGTDTRALDDVSITFAETGLVFLLGKSGSGKSTLLNVCGGLDEPTSGEVIVKGKSSKDFSGSDFDSYRNTFVGFIFQEYNVLDEFNVEDNIALALELQGKNKDKQKIHDLLAEVELEKFAKRKPNTLSGGQKQRIAIARALVKDPQIIMADEPTGALDSNTGKQVFDTLKNLSRERLVIVVSHDREFAEIYGDRIVELKDGKIISDVSKEQIPPKSLDENVTIVGDDTLSIKSGATLTKDNLKKICDFVQGSSGDVIITKGPREITAFKKANRMTDDGSTETFADTSPDAVPTKEYTKEESKFIRSRLPARKAIRIGASGLKLKPVRLIFTILLSLIAFVMFGLFSTLMTYNPNEVTATSFKESDYEYFNFTKYYGIDVHSQYGYDYVRTQQIKFTDKELRDLTDKFGPNTFAYYGSEYRNYEVDNLDVKKDKTTYYQINVTKFAVLPDSHPLVSSLVAGKAPSAADEVCISSYFAEAMLSENSSYFTPLVDGDGRVTYGKEPTSVSSVADIVDKKIVVDVNNNDMVFKISGIFDSGTIPAEYKDISQSDYMLSYRYENYLKEGLHQLVAVSQSFYDEYAKYGIFDSDSSEYINYFDSCNNQFKIPYLYYDYRWNDETQQDEWVGDEQNFETWFSVAAMGSKENQLDCYKLGEQAGKVTSLQSNELVLPLYYFTNFLNKQIIDYYLAQPGTEPMQARQKLYDFDRKIREYTDGSRETYDEEANNWTWENISTDERQKVLTDEILPMIAALSPFELEITVDSTRSATVTVVGFHVNDITNSNNNSREGIYFSQSFIDQYLDVYSYDNGETTETKYEPEEGTKYNGIFVAYDHSDAATNALVATIGDEDNRMENDVFYSLKNSLYETIQMANGYAEDLSTIFLWVGVVFAVFAALLMFNFISMSISNKRKEIGILRAVGARGTDVFKIFFAEAGIIVGICTVLAIIGTFLACSFINNLLKSEIGLGVTLFVFGLASVGMMLAIAVAVAFVSTFLPVFFAARKKPVESIRAL